MKNPFPSAWGILSMLFGSSKRMLHESPLPEKTSGQKMGVFTWVLDKLLFGLIVVVVGPILAVLMTLVLFYLFIMAALSFVQWAWENEKIREWRDG